MVEIYVNEDLCKGADGCGLCIYICPKDVYVRAEELTMRGIRPPIPVRTSECNGCENCMIYCPDMAIVVSKDGKEGGGAERSSEGEG